MFAKLLKYEWKATWHYIGILCLGAVAASLMGGGAMRYLVKLSEQAEEFDGTVLEIVSVFLAGANCLSHTLFCCKLNGACTVKLCSASVDNIGNRTKIKLNKIAVNQTVIASDNTEHSDSVYAGSSYNCTNCGVHSGSVSSAC